MELSDLLKYAPVETSVGTLYVFWNDAGIGSFAEAVKAGTVGPDARRDLASVALTPIEKGELEKDTAPISADLVAKLTDDDLERFSNVFLQKYKDDLLVDKPDDSGTLNLDLFEKIAGESTSDYLKRLFTDYRSRNLARFKRLAQSFSPNVLSRMAQIKSLNDQLRDTLRHVAPPPVLTMPTITSPFERLYDELGELTNIARDSANVQLSQNGLTQQMLEELAANNTQAIKTARISFKIAVVAIVVSGILAAVAAKISWDAYKQDKKNYAEQDEAQKAMIDLLKRQAAAAEETAKIVERLRIQQEQLQQQRAKATPPTKQPGKSSPSSPPRSP
jgi:hypothetical protein